MRIEMIVWDMVNCAKAMAGQEYQLKYDLGLTRGLARIMPILLRTAGSRCNMKDQTTYSLTQSYKNLYLEINNNNLQFAKFYCTLFRIDKSLDVRKRFIWMSAHWLGSKLFFVESWISTAKQKSTNNNKNMYKIFVTVQFTYLRCQTTDLTVFKSLPLQYTFCRN